jgi:multisubunit Na+/H+ antiporter MnhE subunit
MSSNAWLSLTGGLFVVIAASCLLWSILLDQSNWFIPIIFGVLVFVFVWGMFSSMLSHMDRENEIDEMLEHYKREHK